MVGQRQSFAQIIAGARGFNVNSFKFSCPSGPIQHGLLYLAGQRLLALFLIRSVCIRSSHVAFRAAYPRSIAAAQQISANVAGASARRRKSMSPRCHFSTGLSTPSEVKQPRTDTTKSSLEHKNSAHLQQELQLAKTPRNTH